MMNVISNLADVNVSVTVASNQENNTSDRYGYATASIVIITMYLLCPVRGK
jgi:hypothetical protein